MILYFYDSNHYCNASRQLLYYFILFIMQWFKHFCWTYVLYLFIYLLNYTEIKSFITVGKCMNVFYIYIYIYIYYFTLKLLHLMRTVMKIIYVYIVNIFKLGKLIHLYIMHIYIEIRLYILKYDQINMSNVTKNLDGHKIDFSFSFFKKKKKS